MYDRSAQNDPAVRPYAKCIHFQMGRNVNRPLCVPISYENQIILKYLNDTFFFRTTYTPDSRTAGAKLHLFQLLK